MHDPRRGGRGSEIRRAQSPAAVTWRRCAQHPAIRTCGSRCNAERARWSIRAARAPRFAKIDDWTIGYRTWGQLNAGKSNAILVLTWFGGTSEGLAGWIGPGNLYDSSKYYVIVVDALGDGVSSTLPDFTMRDMVRSQYELLTRELHLDHVYAVSGLSMGGMQTFQWVVSYPEFMTKAIPIVGTPKMTAYDLLLWKTELSLLDAPNGMKANADINEMNLHTPAYIATHTKDVDALMKSHEESLAKMNPKNYAAQLRAMTQRATPCDLACSVAPRCRAEIRPMSVPGGWPTTSPPMSRPRRSDTTRRS